MKYLLMAFRSLFKKGRNNGIKILSLGVGLAMGLILISKVIFELSYDNFFPDQERIYRMIPVWKDSEGEGEEWWISGGVIPGMKNGIPDIEEATRYTFLGYMTFRTPDKHTYKGEFIFADEHFFDVLPLPVLAGDAKEALSRPMSVLVSEKIAHKMGGVEQAMGKIFEIDSSPGIQLTIGGVFKDLPENSHLNYDVILSMVTLSRFMRDGTDNWDGNDRYGGYIKLYPGVEPESLYPAFRRIQEQHMAMDKLLSSGEDVHFILVPLTELHSRSPETKRMTLLLGLLAFALIFTAIMNYILIVLSSLTNRTREVAVYKSYGASGKNILSLMMTETAIHLFFALLLSTFLIFLFRMKIYEILNVSVAALFTPKAIGIIAVICGMVFLISGIIPSFLFARIPVAATFRSFKESRRTWKLASLFVQFIATMFLVSLLVVIGKQYRMMVHYDSGYTYENLIYCDTKGIEPEERQKAIEEVGRLSCVQGIATCSTLPMWGTGGNTVSLPGENINLFYTADMEKTDEHFLSLLDIPLQEGQPFDPTFYSQDTKQLLVSRSFADRLVLLTGWTDGIVGKRLIMYDEQLAVVAGVFSDIRLSSVAYNSSRPVSMWYGKSEDNPILVIRLHQLLPEDIRIVSHTLEEVLPDKNIEVYTYQTGMVNLYEPSRLFRDAVMIGGIVTLLISLIGLIGYLKDEMNRRRSEIAVRRINGGTVSEILLLFVKGIAWIAVPAVVLGGLVAYVASTKWLEGFSVKTDLPLLLFAGCGITVLLLIVVTIGVNGYNSVNENPVQNLRSE